MPKTVILPSLVLLPQNAQLFHHSAGLVIWMLALNEIKITPVYPRFFFNCVAQLAENWMPVKRNYERS